MLDVTDKIELKNGITWRTMPQTQVIHCLDQDAAIEKLQHLVDEWHEAAGGADLHGVQGDIGAILDDFCNILGIDPEEWL